MKKGPAIIAALVTTLAIGLLMLAIGINAFLNPNQVAAAQAPGQSSVLNTSSDPSAQVQQLQSLVVQYQAREKQYQGQLNQLQQELSQASTQAQQYQDILSQLQQMGVIAIHDGQIFVRRGGFGGDDDGGSFFGGSSNGGANGGIFGGQSGSGGLNNSNPGSGL